AELDAWAAYYQRTLDYWQSVVNAMQAGEPERASLRQDLTNILALEKREKADIERRLADLRKTLSEKGVDENQPAGTELSKLLALKDDNSAKLERAIKEYDAGKRDLDQRRELARKRVAQARQMAHSVDVERPLWNALYSGKVNRLDLEYDRRIP